MTVRELEEQSGECVQLGTPFIGLDGLTYRFSILDDRNDVYIQTPFGNDAWKFDRLADAHDVRVASMGIDV